jgi:hypothetical protein
MMAADWDICLAVADRYLEGDPSDASSGRPLWITGSNHSITGSNHSRRPTDGPWTHRGRDTRPASSPFCQ